LRLNSFSLSLLETLSVLHTLHLHYSSRRHSQFCTSCILIVQCKAAFAIPKYSAQLKKRLRCLFIHLFLRGCVRRNNIIACFRRFARVNGIPQEFSIDENDVVRFKGYFCEPRKSDVKIDILKEGQRTPYIVRPSETKMYRDLNQSLLVKNIEVWYCQVCGSS
jgi:hypothetical protein